MTRSCSLLFIFTAMLILLAVAARAALPPQYQRLEELHAVLDSAASVLKSKPIDAVEYTGPDEYVVRAGDCVVTIKIVDVPDESGMVGPRKFKTETGVPMCE